MQIKFQTIPEDAFLASDPDTSLQKLLELAENYPGDILENPALSRLEIEEPSSYQEIMLKARCALIETQIAKGLITLNDSTKCRFIFDCVKHALSPLSDYVPIKHLCKLLKKVPERKLSPPNPVAPANLSHTPGENKDLDKLFSMLENLVTQLEDEAEVCTIIGSMQDENFFDTEQEGFISEKESAFSPLVDWCAAAVEQKVSNLEHEVNLLEFVSPTKFSSLSLLKDNNDSFPSHMVPTMCIASSLVQKALFFSQLRKLHLVDDIFETIAEIVFTIQALKNASPTETTTRLFQEFDWQLKHLIHLQNKQESNQTPKPIKADSS